LPRFLDGVSVRSEVGEPVVPIRCARPRAPPLA
jgi:hypothetical protein